MRSTVKRYPLPSSDRWFVSYADFITLLFALFVVLFAASQTDQNHAKLLSRSMARAFDGGKPAPLPKQPAQALVPIKPLLPPPPVHSNLGDSLEILKTTLAEELRNGSVDLRLEQRGLVVSLDSAAFFPSGESTINGSAIPIIGKVAAVLNNLPNPLRLEGHTDSIPIQTARFRSNWELSAARSISMLEILNSQFGVVRERMAIVGYADTGSRESNQTEEGRSRNRRVDIVILSE